ncbi:hypothetical protein HC723_15565 [Vibrio sp. S11_S32]|uniref:hypothetical protein n=1 Tax=Vibrio sp. S11_S32 TaxID=2720225 RepID=UPI00168177CA|nr:hypothetical protein [Vibrio sp. S11_S32]MBD1577815.1 hypothetical protein [Vibrio sp. S11_S32]
MNGITDWVVPLISRISDLGGVDLILLYRILELSAPDKLAEYVVVATKSDYQQAQKLVEWLIHKGPESAYSSLAAISSANEHEKLNVMEILAEVDPEKIPEFTQQWVDSVTEATENMRAADREAIDMDHTVADVLSMVEKAAPEHTEEVAGIVEQALEEYSSDNQSIESDDTAQPEDEKEAIK